MTTNLQVRPDLKAELDKLAESTHRSQSDLANEAIELNLDQERRTVEKIKTGLAQADDLMGITYRDGVRLQINRTDPANIERVEVVAMSRPRPARRHEP